MTLFNDLKELKKAYNATDETIKKVIEVFQQGDYRYTDPWNAIIVAGFLDNNAINMERKEEEIPVNLSNLELEKIKGPQANFKLFSKKIAEEKGFTIKDYESSIAGGKTDILAVKDDLTLLIECCSCRISKATDYLSQPNTHLWVMLKNLTKKIVIFEFTRGKNWTTFNKFHNGYLMNQIQKNYNALFPKKVI